MEIQTTSFTSLSLSRQSIEVVFLKSCFRLHKYPMFGKLVLKDCASEQISNFTQFQLDQNQVFYCHHDKHSNSNSDNFNFTVAVDNLSENNSVISNLRLYLTTQFSE